jgi:hypothetical protein
MLLAAQDQRSETIIVSYVGMRLAVSKDTRTATHSRQVREVDLRIFPHGS